MPGSETSTRTSWTRMAPSATDIIPGTFAMKAAHLMLNVGDDLSSNETELAHITLGTATVASTLTECAIVTCWPIEGPRGTLEPCKKRRLRCNGLATSEALSDAGEKVEEPVTLDTIFATLPGPPPVFALVSGTPLPPCDDCRTATTMLSTGTPNPSSA